MNTLYFKFEEDFVDDDVRCIPMIVRFKLDACGIKLKLAEWSKMTVEERNKLAESSCDTSEEVKTYGRFVQHLVRAHSNQEATSLAIDPAPAWAQLHEVPQVLQGKIAEFNISISLRQWKMLRPLQRFALIKLSAGGHEHKNLYKALHEFQLAGEHVFV
ncbi:MAG: nitrate reductase associated protein [Marivirga sp.]|nr:nitrate reductase associated protein [Marivirga sp.]